MPRDKRALVMELMSNDRGERSTVVLLPLEGCSPRLSSSSRHLKRYDNCFAC